MVLMRVPFRLSTPAIKLMGLTEYHVALTISTYRPIYKPSSQTQRTALGTVRRLAVKLG